MRHAAWLLAILLACGGRNLDPPALEEGSGGSATPAVTSAGGVGGAGGAGGDGATGGGDGGSGGEPPPPAPMPIACLTCVGTECPETVACVTNPACVQGLVCAVSDCLQGGGAPDLFCVAGCFDGDLGAAAEAVTAFLCITGTCGEVCGDFLPF